MTEQQEDLNRTELLKLLDVDRDPETVERVLVELESFLNVIHPNKSHHERIVRGEDQKRVFRYTVRLSPDPSRAYFAPLFTIHPDGWVTFELSGTALPRAPKMTFFLELFYEVSSRVFTDTWGIDDEVPRVRMHELVGNWEEFRNRVYE